MGSRDRDGLRPRGGRLRRGARNARDRLLRPQSLNQAGRTAFQTIWQDDITSLRHYPPRREALPPRRYRVPLVIVPPLAVNMLIYDLFEQRSLVRFLRDSGFSLYLIDWGRPERRHDERHLSDYIQGLLPQALAQVRAHSGEQDLSLHGWSMGGLFASCYAALGDPDIRNLVLLGAPCDYHAPGGMNWQNRLLSRQLRGLHRLTGFNPHRTRREWWRSPGWANALAFKLASPTGTLRGYTELLRRLDDRDHVESHATQAAFLDDMVAYPGGVMQDVVQYLLTENRLARGRLPLPDGEASLAAVQASTLLLTGDRDPIVPPASSERLLQLIGSQDASLSQVPGGHMSIVSGRQAPAQIWPVMRDWLASRST